jgi:hypothetical protein|tara:strand:+ start:513 stop:920 length:408 start_codon:yes stop_codon:yes gene_type:complete
MTGLVYKELPVEDITHLTRPEFVNGIEQKFHDTLLESITQYGMRDPVYINQLKDGTLKVTVGNNRMVIAKELGIKKIPCVIKLHNPQDNNLNGRILHTEKEIEDVFHSKEGLEIKKEDGIIYEVMPKNYQRNGKI